MFERLVSILTPAKSHPAPTVAYRTRLARLILERDVKRISEYLKTATGQFGKDLADSNDYLPLLSNEFFQYWTREFSYEQELVELRKAFQSFRETGTFEFKNYSFPKVKSIQQGRLRAAADDLASKGRAERLLLARLCVYFLTTGGYSPRQESVQKLSALAKRAASCSGSQLDALLLLNCSSLEQIVSVFEMASSNFEIVSALFEGSPVPDWYYGKEDIEKKVEALKGDVVSVLKYYAAFLEEVEH